MTGIILLADNFEELPALKADARSRAEAHGHDLTAFRHRRGHRARSTAYCRGCGEIVIVGIDDDGVAEAIGHPLETPCRARRTA